MSDLGDIAICMPGFTALLNTCFNLYHANHPDAPLSIHVTSAVSTSGDAYLIQNGVLVDRVGIASNGDIFFYDIDQGTYFITTAIGTGEDWTVVIGVPTTTGSFTTAAIGASQTVAASTVAGLAVNQYIQVNDGTHIINGQITGISSLNLTVVTKSIQGTSGGTSGLTMASGANIFYSVSITQLHAANRATAVLFT